MLGAVLVFFLFTRKEDEESLLARYHAEDRLTADIGTPQPVAAVLTRSSDA